MNFTILRFETLGSTNDEAARQARLGAEEGVCVIASQQTAGRGRRERLWNSPKDAGIYFSLILRPKISQRTWAMVTLMGAAAVSDAIAGSAELKTDIKWANDIYANGKKLSGILAETVENAGGAIVLGIGINLKREAIAPELREIATSIETETGVVPNYERVLLALTQELKKYYEILHENNGSEKIIEAWTARSSYAQGKQVRVTLENSSFVGTTCGLEPDGALRVRAENGLIKTIYAGDVIAVRPKT